VIRISTVNREQVAHLAMRCATPASPYGLADHQLFNQLSALLRPEVAVVW